MPKGYRVVTIDERPTQSSEKLRHWWKDLYHGRKVQLRWVEQPPHTSIEPVTHDDEEIIYVLEGTMEETIGGQTFTIAPGTVLFVHAGTTHSGANTSRLPCRMLVFRYDVGNA